MKKKVVQDVIPPKKSIRNIDLPSRTRDLEDISNGKKDNFTRPVTFNRQAPIKIDSALIMR